MPRALRWRVPAKITSSMRWLRKEPARCSPKTQRMASTTLDLPQPLGPTMAVMPGSKGMTIFWAKDLKPKISS